MLPLGPGASRALGPPLDFSTASLPGDLAREIGDSDGDWQPDSCDGDVNNDGVVGSADFLLFARCLGEPAIGDCAPADIDGDGVIGFYEYSVIAPDFGQPVCGGAGTP